MKNSTKYWIAGGIGIVSILGALAYLQYKKLMDYCIGFKAVKIRNISPNQLNFDIWLTFLNRSNITFTLVSQKYKVYLNDIYVTTLSNKATNIVPAKQTSELALNVDINPSAVLKTGGLSFLKMLSDYKQITVKIDMKMRVKAFGLTFPIPYVYEDTLAGMMGTDSENQSKEKTESNC